jgi:two-component system OmpR family response regulator
MPRMLVADADEDTRKFVCRLSRRRLPGVQVVCTDSGLEALDLLSRGEYSVAIVDQDVRYLSGAEVIRRASWRQVRTPLVLLAAGATRALALRARQVGARDLLEKPVSVSQIDAVLHDYVGLRRLRKGS